MAGSPAAAPPRVFRAALVDISGTLHVGSAALPGAVQALQRLRSAGIAVRFVTNTTKQTVAELLETLRGLGFEVPAHEVFSSLTATRRLLEARGLRPLLLVHPRALHEFEGLPTADPDCVVVGLAQEAFSYQNLNRAFRLLLQPGTQLIAVHRGRVFREADGLSLGPGPFVLALEDASGRAATVVGKPEPSFFHQALADLGCRPEEAVMIGDDARDDVGGAQAAGCAGVLVRTGKFREGDAERAGVQPAATCPDFAAAVDWLLQQNELAGQAAARQHRPELT